MFTGRWCSLRWVWCFVRKTNLTVSQSQHTKKQLPKQKDSSSGLFLSHMLLCKRKRAFVVSFIWGVSLTLLLMKALALPQNGTKFYHFLLQLLCMQSPYISVNVTVETVDTPCTHHSSALLFLLTCLSPPAECVSRMTSPLRLFCYLLYCMSLIMTIWSASGCRRNLENVNVSRESLVHGMYILYSWLYAIMITTTERGLLHSTEILCDRMTNHSSLSNFTLPKKSLHIESCCLCFNYARLPAMWRYAR